MVCPCSAWQTRHKGSHEKPAPMGSQVPCNPSLAKQQVPLWFLFCPKGSLPERPNLNPRLSARHAGWGDVSQSSPGGAGISGHTCFSPKGRGIVFGHLFGVGWDRTTAPLDTKQNIVWKGQCGLLALHMRKEQAENTEPFWHQEASF